MLYSINHHFCAHNKKEKAQQEHNITMAKGKSDPRKVANAVVYTNCMNVINNVNECLQFFGSQYKTSYTNRIVQFIYIDKTKAGRNQT